MRLPGPPCALCPVLYIEARRAGLQYHTLLAWSRHTVLYWNGTQTSPFEQASSSNVWPDQALRANRVQSQKRAVSALHTPDRSNASSMSAPTTEAPSEAAVRSREPEPQNGSSTSEPGRTRARFAMTIPSSGRIGVIPRYCAHTRHGGTLNPAFFR